MDFHLPKRRHRLSEVRSPKRNDQLIPKLNKASLATKDGRGEYGRSPPLTRYV